MAVRIADRVGGIHGSGDGGRATRRARACSSSPPPLERTSITNPVHRLRWSCLTSPSITAGSLIDQGRDRRVDHPVPESTHRDRRVARPTGGSPNLAGECARVGVWLDLAMETFPARSRSHARPYASCERQSPRCVARGPDHRCTSPPGRSSCSTDFQPVAIGVPVLYRFRQGREDRIDRRIVEQALLCRSGLGARAVRTGSGMDPVLHPAGFENRGPSRSSGSAYSCGPPAAPARPAFGHRHLGRPRSFGERLAAAADRERARLHRLIKLEPLQLGDRRVDPSRRRRRRRWPKPVVEGRRARSPPASTGQVAPLCPPPARSATPTGSFRPPPPPFRAAVRPRSALYHCRRCTSSLANPAASAPGVHMAIDVWIRSSTSFPASRSTVSPPRDRAQQASFRFGDRGVKFVEEIAEVPGRSSSSAHGISPSGAGGPPPQPRCRRRDPSAGDQVHTEAVRYARQV